MSWRKKIKIKQFLTESEKREDIQESMNKVADELEKHPEFKQHSFIKKMRQIPEGDEVFSPSDYANKILAKMYDVADEERIWIE